MIWLCLTLEFMYIGLLLISCLLLSAQLCIRAWFPSSVRWGQMLNAFAAVFTVLGGTARCYFIYIYIFVTDFNGNAFIFLFILWGVFLALQGCWGWWVT